MEFAPRKTYWSLLLSRRALLHPTARLWESCSSCNGIEGLFAVLLEPRLCRNERALEDEREQKMLITLIKKSGFAASPVNVTLQAW